MNEQDYKILEMVFAMARVQQIQQSTDENALITIIELKKKLLTELSKVPVKK